MKHRKLKKAVLITLFCLLILLEAVGISSGVMSIITAFGQALIGKAIFYIFLEIMTTMLYLNLLTFIWSEIRELRQAPANMKADVTPTEGVASDPGTAWTAFNNFLTRYDALQEQYQCAVQRKNELSEENRRLKEQHDKLLEENHQFKSMIELEQWEQARLAKLEADEKEFEEYQTALLCGTLRLKDIPERMRMDPQRAWTLHILAFRADRGLSKEWYAEDLRFMEQEIELARSCSDTKLEYMLKHVYEDASVTFDTYQWNKRED